MCQIKNKESNFTFITFTYGMKFVENVYMGVQSFKITTYIYSVSCYKGYKFYLAKLSQKCGKLVEIKKISAHTLSIGVNLRFVTKTSLVLFQTKIMHLMIIMFSLITSFSKSTYNFL